MKNICPILIVGSNIAERDQVSQLNSEEINLNLNLNVIQIHEYKLLMYVSYEN